MGVSPQDAEDVASTIMARLVEADIIGMYDSAHVSSHTGSPVSFRSFFQANVSVRVRGQRDKLNRLAGHESLICDAPAEDGTSWIDLFGGSWWDDYSHLDAAEFVSRMRTWLALQPPRTDQDRCDLVGLFDEMVREIETEGKVSYPEIQQRFGVGYTTARVYVGRVRKLLEAGIDCGVMSRTWTIGGVTLDITELRQAVTILRGCMSTAVRQPLARAGHPLGSAPEPKWYHPFAQDELAVYPELKHSGGSKAQHFGHVKTAVLHRMERLLAEVRQPAAETPEPAPAPLLRVIPPPRVAPDEDPLTPAEELESILWMLQADAPTVTRALALAAQVSVA